MKQSLKILVTVLLAQFSFACIHAETITLTPGILPSLVKEWTESKPNSLTLTGEASALDLAALKGLPSTVETLDLSSLVVKGITLNNSNYHGQSQFSDGELPAYSLFCTNVKTLRLPASLRSIGEAAFARTPITSIELPATVSYIGPRVFYLCESMVSANLSASAVAEIPEQCFYGCSALKTISLPATVTSVGNRAFMKSGIAAISLPNASVIGEYAFAEMPELQEVTVDNDASFAEGAFFGDGSLSYLNTLGNSSAPLSMANTAPQNLTISVSGQIVEEGAYANLKTDTVVILPSVKEIKSQAFRNATNLRLVDVSELGSNVPAIAEDAFQGVDVRKVKLATTPGEESVWKAAPVWQDFSIGQEATGIKNPEAVKIDIRLSGNLLEITSNENISNVTIWSLGGITLFDAQPNDTHFTAGPFEGSEVLVRVSAGDIVKLMKILL